MLQAIHRRDAATVRQVSAHFLGHNVGAANTRHLTGKKYLEIGNTVLDGMHGKWAHS